MTNKQKQIIIDCHLLNVNINRMMETQDKKSLREMYDWACKYLSRIYSARYEILDLERGEHE